MYNSLIIVLKKKSIHILLTKQKYDRPTEHHFVVERNFVDAIDVVTKL